MQEPLQTTPAWRSSPGAPFVPTGAWTMRHLEVLVPELERHPPPPTFEIDGQKLSGLDTAGAMIILKSIGATPPNAQVKLLGFAPHHRKVMEIVLDRFRPSDRPPPEAHPPLVEEVGRGTVAIAQQAQGFLSFFGEAAIALLRLVREPQLFRPRELFVQLERVCVYAIPIVSLVTFLIGVVVAYLSATQLQK
ncbi:MAG: hypothetical protein RL417_2570, partial [Pseudomonadota bacterium]